jgi:peptidoglycan/LPS O-acetylase OafA/YrhL
MLPFGDGNNPPSLSLGGYGILMGLFIWRAATFAEQYRFGRRAVGIIAKFGDCSLYIFLYHMLVMQVFRTLLPDAPLPFRCFVVLPLMFLFPCLMKFSWDRFKKFYKTIVIG